MELYTVTQFCTHYEWKESDITVMCNGTCVHVTLSSENFQEARSVKEQYLKHLDALESDNHEALEDLYDWALEPLLPLFRQIDSIPIKRQTVTLHDYFYPDVLKYKLHSDGGVLVASLRDGNDDGPQRKGVDLSLLDLSFPLPLFCPSEVSICNKISKHALTEYPTKVLVGKEAICYLKVFSPGCEREALREINAHIRINELEIRDGLHVPFLFGLVQGEDSTSCLGLLLSYVDCNNMTLEGIVSIRPQSP